ncbi:hypothetical protein [Corallococcus sp. Z5C101001]|uniref:hypothetical protein n=1 Tax=Corallococcus sp. Z5C101001 TaxID=2596829 RepID=UPI00117D950E|nr:hypothetical protein [Corallococcus sp. Z5C101001]TSC20328.1 hypothetical protein FOF48_35705 [Corallococcus sp. Z5C101001]
MPVRVKVDGVKLERLRRSPTEVLRALDTPCRDIARLALDYSLFLVPVGEGQLRDSAFLSGPLHNLSRRLSTTWTAGFAHPSAGPIHEGWHWGAQLFNPPPHFLRKSFRRARGSARRRVAAVLKDFLAQRFPSH